jgi:hypothetical protein
MHHAAIVDSLRLRQMDSVVLEALAEARAALDEMGGVSDAQPLRQRHEMVECAASRIDLLTASREHVVTVALLALEVRDAANELRRAHRAIKEALLETMD